MGLLLAVNMSYLFSRTDYRLSKRTLEYRPNTDPIPTYIPGAAIYPLRNSRISNILY